MADTILELDVTEDPDGNWKMMEKHNYEWDAEVGDTLTFNPPLIFNGYEDVEIQINAAENCEMWVNPYLQFELDTWSKAINNTGIGNWIKDWHLGNLFRIKIRLQAKTTALRNIGYIGISLTPGN